MLDSLMAEVDDLFRGKPFLTVDDVMQLLNCNEQVVYNWTKRADPSRRPPRIPVGKELRFPKRAFIQWLAGEQGKKSVSTEENE